MKTFIHFLIFGYSSFFFAQEINHYSFNNLYNFNVSTIYDIDQSPDQKMWFATNEGLISFDGVNFKTFTNDNYDIEYANIKFDQYGRVWCSNFGGQLFYLEDNKLELAINWQNQGDFIRDYSVFELPQIQIVGTSSIEVYNFNADSTASKQSVFKLDRTKVLSMSTKGKIQYAIFNQKDEKDDGILKLYKPGQLPVNNIHDNQYRINLPYGKWNIFGKDNKKYVYHFKDSGRLLKLEENNKVKTISEHLDLSVYDFNHIEFINNYIWILTKNGVTIKDENGKTVNSKALKDISASAIFQDKEKNTWIGTLNKGVFIIPNLEFQSLKLDDGAIVNSIIDDNGNLFILNDKGSLYFLDLKNKLSDIQQLATNINPAPLFYDKTQKKLFIGDFRTYYDCVNKTIIKEDDITKRMSFKESISIEKGKYVFTNYSNAQYYCQNNTPFTFFKKPESDNVIRSFRSKNIAISKSKSSIYIDYIDGLFHYAKNNSSRVKWKNKDVLVSELIADTQEDSVVWVTTKTKELLKLKNGKVIDLFELPYIADDIAIHKDHFFLASQQGIIKLNRQDKSTQIIDETEGWIKGNITSIKVLNNECFIAGSNHIQKIPVDFSPTNKIKPTVFITSINNDKITQLSTDITGEDINFPPDKNNIGFSFRSLSVKSQKKLTYQYRLANKDENWVTVSSDNPEAIFLNLDAGDYVFEVKACNDSQICSNSKSVRFSIEQYFYKKPWFILGVFLLVIISLYYFFQQKFKAKEKQEKLKAEQERLRKENYKSKIAAIRSQMNPHFMFNALNTIQEFILTNQQDIASEYLADFADLMRMYLNQSKTDYVDLSTEIDNLKLYLRLESLRFNNELKYNIEIDPLINKDATMIPVMLLQPFIENSIKHGLLHKKGNKKLRIQFQKIKDDGFKCIIEDNGVGRASSAKINASKTFKHQSFATSANQSRVDLINQNRDKKISVRTTDLYFDKQASGTRVEIIIS